MRTVRLLFHDEPCKVYTDTPLVSEVFKINYFLSDRGYVYYDDNIKGWLYFPLALEKIMEGKDEISGRCLI